MHQITTPEPEQPINEPLQLPPSLQWLPLIFSECDMMHMQALGMTDRALLEMVIEAYRVTPDMIGETYN